MEISVSELIKYFKPEFDVEFHSATTAIKGLISKADYEKEANFLQKINFNISYFLDKYDITILDYNNKVKEIKDKWKSEYEIRRERGNRVHAMLEEKNGKAVEYLSDSIDMDDTFEYVDELDFDTDKAYYPEYKMEIYFKSLKLKGRADLIVKDGNNITIVDYKTYDKIVKSGHFNSFTKKKKTLKFPLNTVQDCNYHITELQLSFYAYMMEVNHPELKIDKLILCQVGKNNKIKNEEVSYLKEDVEKALNRYISEDETKKLYDDLKPIDY